MSALTSILARKVRRGASLTRSSSPAITPSTTTRRRPGTVPFRFKFPAQKAVYDGLSDADKRQRDPCPPATVSRRMGKPLLGTGRISRLSYCLPLAGTELLALQIRGWSRAGAAHFALNMREPISKTSIRLMPPSRPQPKNRRFRGELHLSFFYSDLISGFQIGMTMPEKLQPGLLAC